MESAGDGGDHISFGVAIEQGRFDDRLAGAGLSEQEAKPALLAMDAKGIEDVLLMGQQGEAGQVEGIFGEAEIGAKHLELGVKVIRRNRGPKNGADGRWKRDRAAWPNRGAGF